VNRRGAAGACLLSVLLVSADGWSRPGGGQSFGGSSRSSSGGSDRSSGSSSGSGSSGRSSGGSSWSFGGSSKTSSGSSRDSGGSGTPSPAYSPSQHEIDERRRLFEQQQDEIACLQTCMWKTQPGESDTCQRACIATKRQERALVEQQTLDREQAQARQRVLDNQSDTGMGRVFLAPLVIGGGVLAFFAAAMWYRRRSDSEWASGLNDDVTYLQWAAPEPAPPVVAGSAHASVAAAIAALNARDDAFSWVLFEDFAHALYTEAHTLRGQGKLDRLEPYLANGARLVLQTLPAAPVSTVIVGALQARRVVVETASRRIVATIAFTANYTEADGARAQSYYAEELWTFSRDADLASRPPARSRVIDCPSCGAPLEKIVAGRCKYCDAVSSAGSHDWRVDNIRLESREPRGPMLTGDTVEVGTDDPTVVAADVKEKFGALVARDPAVAWLPLTQRFEKVFAEFHRAWSTQSLLGVRPYLSDNLFETQQYWVTAYKADGLQNLTEAAKIAAIHLSRVSSDKYFDAITVRMYASCLDYTLNAANELVGGSRFRVREYSEYWTFIRGKAASGAAKADDTCPNCGAPTAEINMAGICGHCRVKVTSGDFDWVLSRIEQDEVYRL